jgi:hypothetical protein
MTTFYCLRFETPPTWRARSPYLYPPGTGWPGYTPRLCVPSSLPSTIRRATVEVFDLASSRVSRTLNQSYIATDGQSVSQSVLVSSTIWGSWPDIYYCFESYGLVFFCGVSSLTRGRVCLLYMLLGLASAVFLGSEFLGTGDHILLSQIWDFPFHRLLRLAGSQGQVKVKVTLRLTISQSLLLASRYIASGMSSQKARPFPSSEFSLLLRIRWNVFT